MLFTVWIIILSALGFYLVTTLINEKTDKRLFLPADTSNGHHQIEEQCDLCHEPFGELKEQGCLDCHAKSLSKASDSHEVKLFKDPRNEQMLEDMNAASCLTCHNEHQQDNYPNGVTVAKDFCVHCHEDVAEDRVTHKGLEFDNCTECHNYHDNTALYEDFLAKHLDEKDTFKEGKLPQRNFLHFYSKKAKHSLDALKLVDHNAPESVDLSLGQDWLESSHAEAGINCLDCHSKKEGDWVNKPNFSYCESCHKKTIQGFLAGKHGIRLAQELSAMTVSQARLPMLEGADAENKILNCTACHSAHKFNVVEAAVSSCLNCHADEHSIAYKKSKHFQLWQDEQQGALEKGAGVSCAGCHLPRETKGKKRKRKSKRIKRVNVQHNQSHNLSPNQKMLRGVCMNCHGLGFSLDSLADKELIKNNFSSLPKKHLKMLEMVKERI